MKPSRLTSLHIQNFKSLKDVKLENLPPLVVLIGENGSGKSSVLEGLCLSSLHITNKEYPNKDYGANIIKVNLNWDNNSFLASDFLTIHNFTYLIGIHQKNSSLNLILSYSKINPLNLLASLDSGYATHLSTNGDNLPLVCKYIQDQYPQIWQEINETLQQFVPGLESVSAHTDETRRTYLRFNNKKFEGMLLPKEMSDGTLLMLAHLVLLRHPKPHPVLCIDEPEHHLYPRFLPILAEEIEAYAERAGTVFMATHSPQLLNSLPFESVYFCKKNTENVTEIYRLSENFYLNNLYKNEGYLAGDLLRDSIIDAQFK